MEKDKLDEIEQRRKNWEENIRKPALAKLGQKASSEFYTPLDVKDHDFLEKVGFPGEYPFTRHIMPTGYRGRLWTRRQYAGCGTVEQTNERYKYLYKQGQTGFSVAFQLPTQAG